MIITHIIVEDTIYVDYLASHMTSLKQSKQTNNKHVYLLFDS